MYSLNMPVSAIRTKLRQEFERHRYVSQLPVVDGLIWQSNMEFQVRLATAPYGNHAYLVGLVDAHPSRRSHANEIIHEDFIEVRIK